jgi:hypothetical protein
MFISGFRALTNRFRFGLGRVNFSETRCTRGPWDGGRITAERSVLVSFSLNYYTDRESGCNVPVDASETSGSCSL